MTNIQKYSIHDGPGIRTTVFFKGCPLLCPWCHNPESQIFSAELAWQKERCIGCGDCLSACPAQALSRGDGGLLRDTARCTMCGACAEVCPALAWERLGKDYTVEQLLAIIQEDRPFYEQSNGGVTFSGGEPLAQGAFVLELLAQCKARGLHTAVDTCGFVPQNILLSAAAYTDLFLYDIKQLDPALHQKQMQAPLAPIVENLRALSRSGAAVWLRLPLIPGWNDSPAELARVAALAQECGLHQLFLLPYHRLAEAKYQRLGLPYALCQVEEPTEARLDEIRQFFVAEGFEAQIGG